MDCTKCPIVEECQANKAQLKQSYPPIAWWEQCPLIRALREPYKEAIATHEDLYHKA